MSSALRLVAFKQESAARLLAQYLQSKGIKARYDNHQDEFEHHVTLLDETQIEQAKSLCDEFLKNPQDPKYQNLAWQSAPLKGKQQTDLGLPKIAFSDARHAPFTWLIFAFCCLVYGVSWLGGFGWVAEHLRILPIGETIETGQWWRILTPALIHFSIIHIVFNLIWWGSLGKQIEMKFGSSTLILLFLITAATSNLGQLLTSGANFGGLSGVVYGVIGFVWIIGWLRPAWNMSLPKPVIGFLLAWLLLGYLDVLWVSMANTAHTVGLIGGCLFASVLVSIGGHKPSK